MTFTIFSLSPELCLLLVTLLSLAVIRDSSRHRIDNWITFSGLACAFALHVATGGLGAVAVPLVGCLAGLLLFMPLYIKGGMAAGDVKLLAAVGACIGPYAVLWAALYTLILGALLAILQMALSGHGARLIQHFSNQIFAFAYTKVWAGAPPGSVLSRRFPYAIAIAGGVAALWLVGLPIKA